MAKKYDAGIRIGIEGNAEFKAAIKEINDELKTLDSELKLVESQYAGQLNSLEALTAKGGVLEKQYEAESKALELLEKQLQATEAAKKRLADEGEELSEGIEAQKAVIEEYKQALQGSKDGALELRDANGNLIRTIEDGHAEVARLEAELKDMERALKANAAAQQDATKLSNSYTRQINYAKVKLNDLDSEIQKNKRYMAEAAASTDKCAKSIDEYGDKVDDATKKSNLLQKIFSGGFLANIATQALHAVINTLKQFAASAIAAADEIAKLSSETGLSKTKLQELQFIVTTLDGDLNTIERAQAKLTKAMDDARRGSSEYAAAFRTLGIEFQNTDGSLRNATDVMFEAFDALGKIGSEAERDAISLKVFGRSAMELNPLIQAGADELERLAQEAHKMGAVMSDEAVSVLDMANDRLGQWKLVLQTWVGETMSHLYELINGTKKATGESIDSLDTITDKMDELNSTYAAVAQSAKESLQSQMGLWEDMRSTATKSYSDIKQAVMSQIDWLTNYSTNLHNLQMRNVEGIDELIAKLADGSKESAAILSGLATASDAELRSLIGHMQEVDTRQEGLSRQIAQIKTDTSRQLNELYTGIRKSAEELNASDIAQKAGRDTIQGYIDGAKSKTKEVVDTYRKLARDANQAYKDELKIKSPSRVAMETTEDYFKGHILAAKQMTAEMAQAYAEPAKKAQMAVQSLLVSPIEEPKPDYAAQAAAIGESISKALAGSSAGRSGTINLVVNLTSEIDGRVVAKATREYLIEENELAGENLIS